MNLRDLHSALPPNYTGWPGSSSLLITARLQVTDLQFFFASNNPKASQRAYFIILARRKRGLTIISGFVVAQKLATLAFDLDLYIH